MNPESLERRIIKTTVTWNAQGVALESFLAGRFTYRSLEEWRERIGSGEITLNGEMVSGDRVLQLHDVIEYRPGDIEEPPCDPDYKVVFEDETLLIVDKPGDLCIHPSGPYFRNTLWHLLSMRYGSIHIVNRLDRETSGLLIVARDAATAARMDRGRNGIRKEYLAVVHGSFPVEIDAKGFLMDDTGSEVRKKRKFVLGERPPAGARRVESSRTLLWKESEADGFSVVRARLETGRMHQIRATLFSLGFPVAGDKLYGLDEKIFLKLRSDSITEEDREKLIFTRQALHSADLHFTHPATGEELHFHSPFPALERYRLIPRYSIASV